MMKIQSCIDAIEKQNEEIVRLQNPCNRKIALNFLFSLFSFKRILSFIQSRSLLKKLAKGKKKDLTPVFYAKGSFLDVSKKVAVYTCITNGYDNVNNPILIDDDMDYFCISDSSKKTKSIWQHLEIPASASKYDYAMINRFCKLNPWNIFSAYDYTIYIDGNIDICSDIRCLCSIAHNSKIGIAMHTHDYRDCIYNEAEACTILKRGNMDAIKTQMAKYRQEGFPEHFGMIEATIIIIDLKNDIAKKIMTEWWCELLQSKSGRDQLSFPYILWKNGFKISDVGCLGNNRRKNPKFRTRKHYNE